MIVRFSKRVRLDGIEYRRGTSALVDDFTARRLIEVCLAREFFPLHQGNIRWKVKRYQCRLIKIVEATVTSVKTSIDNERVLPEPTNMRISELAQTR